MKLFRMGISTLLLWLAVLTPQAQTPVRKVPILPSPAGPFAVGRAAFDWTDQTRSEVFSKDSSTKRELMVYLWYPYKPNSPASDIDVSEESVEPRSTS